jgi:hypothetical protein
MMVPRKRLPYTVRVGVERVSMPAGAARVDNA